MLKKIFSIGKSKREIEYKQEKFNNIMSFARDILEESIKNPTIYILYDKQGNKHPIIDLINTLGRSVQAYYINEVIYRGLHHAPESPCSVNLFITNSIDGQGKNFYDCFQKVQTRKRVNLARDFVLPGPWHRQRFASVFTDIGEGRRAGSWHEDTLNHYIELWLPIGVGFVNGGNHSIGIGIIQSKGSIKPNIVYDITKLYDYVKADGAYFRRTKDNQIISDVPNVELAAIFEIGRLMAENSLTF